MVDTIKSRTGDLSDICLPVSLLDKTRYACDELCGFLTPCAVVRPLRLEGLTPASVNRN